MLMVLDAWQAKEGHVAASRLSLRQAQQRETALRNFLLRAAVVLVLAISFGSSAMAQDKREANMIKSLELSPTAHVTYLDEAGKPLDFDSFFKLVLAGRSVSVRKDKKADTAVVSVEAPGRANEPERLGVKVSVGDPLPAFRLKDGNGSLVTNDTIKGRHTLVNFVYSECGPCIAEIPSLNAFSALHPEFGTIAVTFDSAQDAKSFSLKRKFNWPLLADAHGFIDAVGITVYPAMVLVGPDGRIVGLATSSQIAGPRKPLTTANLLAWVSGLMGAGALK